MSLRVPILFCVVLWCGCAKEPAPPNILLISIDALRADRLGSYGYERDTSPFLDALAARGLRFENAFVNTHGTTPSHTSLLSGLYQETHGVGFEQQGGVTGGIPDEVALLPEMLQAAGYATVGVTGGGNIGGKFGFSRGFERFFDRGSSIERVLRQALGLLDEALLEERPIFLFVHTYEVHSPYRAPPEIVARFDPGPSTFAATSENLLKHVSTAGSTLTAADRRRIGALYDAGIAHTDAALGGFFTELERRGFLDNALVVVTADHGEELGEHGGLLHRGLLYDELIRVPLLVSGLAIENGVREDFVEHVDVVPSILALADIEAPAALEGRVAWPQVERPRRAAISQYAQRRYAVRAQEWKMIETTALHRIELYHLVDDPGETDNIAEAHPEVVGRFRAVLRQWRAKRQPPGAVSPAVALSEEERRELVALGYLSQ